jgi:hypothetical protein
MALEQERSPKMVNTELAILFYYNTQTEREKEREKEREDLLRV